MTQPLEPGSAPPGGRGRALYELTKPGIAGFVMITAGVSYYVGAGGSADFLPVLHLLGGVALATAGALALNQYLEREVDGIMTRTRRRPIPSGRLTPGQALAFGVILLLAGLGHLAWWVGILPAGLTAFSAAAYLFMYTPLKTRSYLATLVGAVPGGLPALIGWTAATGSISLGGVVLFGMAFLWQLPHVLALSWLLRDDYALAGFLLGPPTDGGGRRIGNQMLAYTGILIPMSVAPTLLGLTGSIYLVGAVLLGIALLVITARAVRPMDTAKVKAVFLASLLYQPLILGLMLVDTVHR